ncbi:MAG: ABC transporter ATP-binding protein [Pseudomonadota bacterium]
MNASSNDLTVRDVTVAYGQTEVVRKLSIDIPQHQLTALVGPNGCGKSTLLKAIARVLPIQSGQVLLGSAPVHTMPTRQVASILGFLPQGPIAPEGLSVRELVAQGRFPHQSLMRQWSSADARAVDQAMAATNIADFADRPIDHLSGGERQRAWIAMVLAQDTPILLLDEPTTFLDLKVQVDIMRLLQRITHDASKTILIVMHELNIAAAFADHLIMMRAGRVRASGDVLSVFTERNLSAVFDLDARVLTSPENGRPVCIPSVA